MRLGPLPPQLDAGQPIEWGHPLAKNLLSCWAVAPRGHPAYRGGSRLLDLCRRYHGTLANGPKWGGGPPGCGALAFDGSDDEVTFPSLSTVLSATAASFAVWVKRDLATPLDDATAGFIDLRYGGNMTHYPYSDGLAYMSILLNGRYNGITLSSAVDRAQWHLLTVSHEAVASGYKVYQNRELVFTGDGTTVGVTVTPTFGASATGSGVMFPGKLGAAFLWNGRALTAQDVASLYDQGVRGYPDLWRSVRRTAWGVPAAPGGFQAAWASGSNVLIQPGVY